MNNINDSSSNSFQNGGSRKRRKRDEKEGIKEIVTSFLLIEDEEKVEEKEWEKITQVEKSKLEEIHKKKTEVMLDYHSKTQNLYVGIDENDRIRRKKQRVGVNSVVSVVASEIIEKSSNNLEEISKNKSIINDNNNSSNNNNQRRMWVKDRSKAWWEECKSKEYPEEEFRKWFRMGKSTFEGICEELNAVVAKEDTMLRAAIPVKQRVAVCIYRLATGDPLRLVSKRFGLGISTCHKLVLEVCSAIRTVLMPRYLQWPSSNTEDEREMSLRMISEEFESISGVPNVVGSMYTTHIPIIAPKISVAAYFNKRHTERNQKTSYSITLQGVVNPSGVFTDICIGWPGSMPDDRVLEKSALYQRGVQGLLKGVWVVGGPSYPLLDWLLVPYSQPNLTWTQHAFNEKIGVLHKVAKDAFARLKGRWCCLQKRTEVKLQDLPMVLGACCVLHNICELRGEKIDSDTVFEIFDDEMVPEVPLQSISSMKARDGIAHNLLHHGLAGTGFL